MLSLNEARAASALNHPGIITIYDVGQSDADVYIVMEWIDGATLRRELTPEHHFPLRASRRSQARRRPRSPERTKPGSSTAILSPRTS